MLALLVVWPPVLVVYLLDDASSELATLLLSVTIGLIIVLQILGSFVAKCLPSSRRAVRSHCRCWVGLVGHLPQVRYERRRLGLCTLPTSRAVRPLMHRVVTVSPTPSSK